MKNINRLLMAGLISLAVAFPAQLSSAYIPRQNQPKKQIEMPWTKGETIMIKYLDNPVTKEFLDILKKIESENNPKAISPKGARGHYQFMEDTWNKWGEGNFYNAHNPIKARKAAKRYLEEFVIPYCERFNSEWTYLPTEEKQKIIVAMYNAGARKIKENNWSEFGISETESHVKKFMKEKGWKFLKEKKSNS